MRQKRNLTNLIPKDNQFVKKQKLELEDEDAGDESLLFDFVKQSTFKFIR